MRRAGGCLAGSVYAAAVILPVDFKNELLNDSKATDGASALCAARDLKEKWHGYTGVVTPEEIDEINIHASFWQCIVLWIN